MSSFCICKSYSQATHIFFSKNACELDIVLTRTVNILITNKLVKLTMLWTTGPWLKKSALSRAMYPYKMSLCLLFSPKKGIFSYLTMSISFIISLDNSHEVPAYSFICLVWELLQVKKYPDISYTYTVKPWGWLVPSVWVWNHPDRYC